MKSRIDQKDLSTAGRGFYKHCSLSTEFMNILTFLDDENKAKNKKKDR